MTRNDRQAEPVRTIAQPHVVGSGLVTRNDRQGRHDVGSIHSRVMTAIRDLGHARITAAHALATRSKLAAELAALPPKKKP